MGNFTDAKRLPSAKFPEKGDTVSGVVLKIEDAEVPEFDDKSGRPTGKPKIDKDTGEIVMQKDVILEQENGKRVVLHTDGGVYWAIGMALANADLEDLEIGDTLSVTYEDDREPTAKGRNGAKQYTATITR